MRISTFFFLTRRGLRNLGKHWAMTFVCILSLSVCMTLNTFASLAEVNVDSMVNYLGSQNETVVYLDPECDDATAQAVGEKLGDKAPKIFNVNWFRKDDDGNFLWPGFGDNMRVLEWIIKRCEGMVDADETAIGFVPKAEDINLAGIEDEVSEAQLKEILSVDNSLWDDEAKGIEEFYSKFGDRLPKALSDELNTLKANLEK